MVDVPISEDSKLANPAAVGVDAGPLCIDLEGELLATNLRWEARLASLKTAPLRLFGDAGIVHMTPLAIEQFRADVSLLPYRQDVLEFLRSQKRGGRRLTLISDLPDDLTTSIAAHLQLFDGISRVRPPGAQWVSHERDFAVGRKTRGLFRALRPHQWLKNLLLLLPLVLAHQVTNLSKLSAGVFAFWSLSFCASAVYILNDLLDLASDRRHPSKRSRPFASGQASIPAGLILAVMMVAIGLAIAAFLPFKFQAMLIGYMLLTTAYSFWLKQKMLLDVMVLASLYTWRIVAGADAVQVPLTMWLLAFSMFFFLSLAFVKRYSELIRIEHAGGDELKGRGYRVSDLRIIEAVGPASGYLSVLVFCNYLDSSTVRGLYARPQVLWLVAPLLLYWITRVWFIARRRLLDDDPVVYAIRDRASQLTGLLAALVVAAAWAPKPYWWPF